MNIGIVGATGLVGDTFCRLLEERSLPVEELRLFASPSSVGKKINFQKKSLEVQVLKEGCFKGLDLVFFSSGDDISREWGPRAVSEGAFAIDNSAAFRQSPEHLLIVPEVNGHLIPKSSEVQLIANPNCSTIQLVVALKPLSDAFGLEDVRVASYQAVSGAGREGQDELMAQVTGHVKGTPSPPPKIFARPISFNCVPQIGSFSEDGFCSEENKIIKETKKIMGLPELRVSAFTVRVPALNAHSEVAWVTLQSEADEAEVAHALEAAPGVIFSQTPEAFPTAMDASGKDPVFVGRLHKDRDNPRTYLLWIVADNILKGAALNGLQIASRIFDFR